ncbi:MAG: B12-binding domain-containing radical SAM protein [Candidatus Omnitrophica bacterium]|nr:B12-binding domain-containing radical SAM protein [Candidatus Omnitrophota bacterium]
MKIALIHCLFSHRIFSENLKVVDEEFCLAPPIILAYVAAILEKAGHKVILIDANALKLNKGKTLKQLKKFGPDVIGFRADTYWFHRVVDWAYYFKDNMDVVVIVGGINITLYPKESLWHKCFDYGIAGEANCSLPALLSALGSKTDVKDIRGVVYRENDTVICNPPLENIVAFDDYPFPARHLLPNELYYSFTSQLKNFTVMVTSTGCPFKCSFCAISRLVYRERSPINVVDEVEECYRKFNVREIDFFDATFFINKERSIAICEEILKRGIKIEWSCRSRTDVVDDDILRAASRAGCRKIYYGIESVSEHVLENINKKINTEQIIHAINLTHKHGISTLGFFMVGNPSDSRGTILSSIKFAKKLQLDFIQVCRTIAKPNTELNDYLIKTQGVDYWREYILGKKPEKRLPTPWSELSEHQIEQYLRKFYSDFYFRFSYIIKRVLKARSLSELFRYVRTAMRWFFSNYSDVKK